MSDDGALGIKMEHERIDADHFADRWVTGRLDEPERRRFEEHFVDCPRCLDSIDAAEGLRDGLGELAGDHFPVSSEMSRMNRPALAAAAALAVALIGGGLLYRALRRADRALETERAAARPTTSTAAADTAIPVAAAVVTLDLSRGPAEEPETVVLERTSRSVVLAFDPPNPPDVHDFRIRLSSADRGPVGPAVAAREGLNGVAAVSVPAALLAPGDYLLVVDGVSPRGQQELARYRFRIVAAR